MQWFGESCGAPICTLSEHVPVPVGEICIECKDGIIESDAGFIIPYYLEKSFTGAFYHRDCFLDSVLGRERLREFNRPAKGE